MPKLQDYILTSSHSCPDLADGPHTSVQSLCQAVLAYIDGRRADARNREESRAGYRLLLSSLFLVQQRQAELYAVLPSHCGRLTLEGVLHNFESEPGVHGNRAATHLDANFDSFKNFALCSAGFCGLFDVPLHA